MQLGTKEMNMSSDLRSSHLAGGGVVLICPKHSSNHGKNIPNQEASSTKKGQN